MASMMKERDRATDPHICIVGHITGHELNALLSSQEIWNGLANRFLWLAVRRGKAVPFPTPMPDADVARIVKELAAAVESAHRNGSELVMSPLARELWISSYPNLTQDHPGILGAITSRAEAQTLRLAMTYAQLSGSQNIGTDHLEAALTFWEFCLESARFLFKGTEVDPMTQKIIQALATGPKTQTEIVNAFGRHLSKERLSRCAYSPTGKRAHWAGKEGHKRQTRNRVEADGVTREKSEQSELSTTNVNLAFLAFLAFLEPNRLPEPRHALAWGRSGSKQASFQRAPSGSGLLSDASASMR